MNVEEMTPLPDCLNIFEQKIKGIEPLEKYEKFLSCLKEIYVEWFGSIKSYDDNHVAEEIFVTERKTKDMRCSIKYDFYALLKSFDRDLECLRNASESPVENNCRKEIKLLNNMSLDVIMFLQRAHYYIKGKYVDYGFYKSNMLDSIDIFETAKSLFEGREAEYKPLGLGVIAPTSIFLLRQAIEVRLRGAFGIKSLEDKEGRLLKKSGTFFIELVRRHSDSISLPIKLSVLEKVYGWTNYYIHSGAVPYIWKVEWALKMMKPLFTPFSEKQKSFDLYGSITIRKSFYDQVEEKIKEIVKEPQKDREPDKEFEDKDIVVRRLSNPAARLVEDSE